LSGDELDPQLADVLTQMPGTRLLVEEQTQRLTVEVERLSNLLHLTLDERNERDATIERVRALIDRWQGGTGHSDGNKFVSIADLKAALGPSRAYRRDPLPNDWTPIWAKAKTPGQEGG
jgi:hypothetical protein